MSIEKKAVNTFWCPEKKYWKVYLTPENPDPDLSILLPTKVSIEESIAELRKEIKENKSYREFTNRLQKNYMAIFEEETEIQETDWAYRAVIFNQLLSLAAGISAAALLYLRIGSPLLQPSNNITSQTNDSSVPENTSYALIDAALGSTVTFTIASCALTIANIILSGKEKMKGQLYDKHMVKLMERLIPIENEIKNKIIIVSKLLNFLNLSEKKFYFRFDSSNQEINISGEDEELDLKEIIFHEIDSKNDIVIYKKIDETLNIVLNFFDSKNLGISVSNLMADLFKMDIINTFGRLTEDQNKIFNSSKIDEILLTVSQLLNSKDVFLKAIKILVGIFEDKNRLIILNWINKIFMCINEEPNLGVEGAEGITKSRLYNICIALDGKFLMFHDSSEYQHISEFLKEMDDKSADEIFKKITNNSGIEDLNDLTSNLINCLFNHNELKNLYLDLPAQKINNTNIKVRDLNEKSTINHKL